MIDWEVCNNGFGVFSSVVVSGSDIINVVYIIIVKGCFDGRMDLWKDWIMVIDIG